MLVLRDGELDRLDARGGRALADETRPLGHEAEPVGDVLDALVRAPKGRLVLAKSLGTLVHNAIIARSGTLCSMAQDVPELDTERAPSALDVGLEDFSEALPFGFGVTDEDGVVLGVNGELATLLGLERPSLIGTPIVEIAPERYRRTLRAALDSLRRDGTSVRWEQELEPRHGEPTAVEVTATAASGSGGQSLVLWVIADIRDRVAVERYVRTLTADLEARVVDRTEALETERARLAAVMGQMPAGLVIVDAPEGNIVSANEEALRILRLDHLDGARPWRGWTMDGKEYGPDEWPLARSRLRGEVVTGERAEIVTADGGRAVIEISSAPVKDGAGGLLGAVCLFSDVTIRQRRERAEREFVTNAAHELQTPLAALVSAVEVLVGGAKDTPERDLFLEHVRRESERLTRLIRSLLVLARVEMGVDIPTTGVVPLRPLLENVARELTPAPNVSVTVACPDELAAVANAELLEHALLNVAENAAKYTVRGSISISATQIENSAEIRVSDTGPGIPPAQRAIIFERFQRGAGGHGSGLGLAIVRSVMEALNGQISVESEPGVGTTFRLRLPFVTALVET